MMLHRHFENQKSKTELKLHVREKPLAADVGKIPGKIGGKLPWIIKNTKADAGETKAKAPEAVKTNAQKAKTKAAKTAEAAAEQPKPKRSRKTKAEPAEK